MIVTESRRGTLLLGRVGSTKPGAGKGADCLTIVTLQDIGGVQDCKVLFWNPKREDAQKLSDRARRLTPGSIISVRGRRDTGDPNKYTAYQMKKAGLYQIPCDSGNVSYYLFGSVRKITYGKKHNATYYVPVYTGKDTIWYRASTWGRPDDIRLGDFVIVHAEGLSLHVWNGFTFHDLSKATIKAV